MTRAALVSLSLTATLLPWSAGIVGICYQALKPFAVRRDLLYMFPLPDKITSPYSSSAERGRARPAFSSLLVLTHEPHPLQCGFQKPRVSVHVLQFPLPCSGLSASFPLLQSLLCVPVQAQWLPLKLRLPVVCCSSWQCEPGRVEPF